MNERFFSTIPLRALLVMHMERFQFRAATLTAMAGFLKECLAGLRPVQFFP